ncbi:MAG: class I SAM-dependent methyltransferase, partial [Nitratireductor sp.]
MQNVIFDPNKLKSARERAKARNQIDSYFLHQEAAEIICDRLSVTNRQFENVALLFDGVYAEKLKQTFEENAQNIVGKFSILSFPNGQEETIEHSENLYLEPNNYDLIISIFDLHWMNDLPGAFSQINKALKPDGLFMSALPSQDCLQFLNAALVEAETHY